MKTANPSQVCAWTDRLRQSLVEPVSEEELALLAAHMDECATCRAYAQRQPAKDVLFRNVHTAIEAKERAATNIAPPTARLNELLTDYVIVSELGRGGMGVVYKARQIKLNRMVALKVLPALLGAVRPDAMERFKREAALAASLKHSNIISVHDFGEVDGTLYYAMELVEGRTLQDLIREMREAGGVDRGLAVVESAMDATPPTRVIASQLTKDDGLRSGSRHTVHTYFLQVSQWIADVADALHFAHVHEVLHRDMKPSNLLLNRDGRLMISDFGLARSSANASLTISHALLGTSRYIAPEMVDPSLGSPGPASDVYALGATLYELLTLQPMFAGSDDREILHLVQHKEAAAPRTIVRQIPRELETICLKATAKRPADRYLSAEEFANDLKRWRLDLPIQARRPSAASRVGRYIRRHRIKVLLVTALVLAISLATGAEIKYLETRKREADALLLARSQQIELLKSQANQAYIKGDGVAAIALLEKLMSLEPDSHEHKRERARALRLLGRDHDQEALEQLKQIAGEHPDDWVTHQLLAMLYLDMSGPGAEETRFHAAQVQQLRPETAEVYCMQALGEPDDRLALELISKAIEMQPTNVGYLLHRAARLDHLERYERMLADMDRVVAMRDGWSFTHAMRGSALRSLERFDEAEKEYTRAIELEGSNGTFWAERSLVRSGLGRYEEALADAERAIALIPDNAKVFVARVRARTGIGDFAAALLDCDHAIEINPSDVQGYRERIVVYDHLGRWEDVLHDATRVIDLAPNMHVGYQNRTLALVRLGRFQDALPDVTRLVELRPDDAESHWMRGFVNDALGNEEDAIADFTRLLNLDDKNVPARYRRARLSLCTRRPEQAVVDLTTLIEHGRKEPNVFVLRSTAYSMLGLEELAVTDMRQMADREGRSDYAMLWLYLVLREHKHEEEATKIADERAANSATALARQLFTFHLGRISAEQLLESASSEGDRCQSQYNIGLKRWIDGDSIGARKAFEECMAMQRQDTLERTLARARLATLDRTPDQSRPH